MISAETRDNENIDGSQHQQAMEGDAVCQLSQPVAVVTPSTPLTSIENNTTTTNTTTTTTNNNNNNKTTPESCLRDGRDSIGEAPNRTSNIVYEDLNQQQQQHRSPTMYLDAISESVETEPMLYPSSNTNVIKKDDDTIGSQSHQLTSRSLHQQPSSDSGLAQSHPQPEQQHPQLPVPRRRGRRRQQAITEQSNGLDRVFVWDIDGSLMRADIVADSPLAPNHEPSVLASVTDKLSLLSKQLKQLTMTFCDENLFLHELELSDQMHIDDAPSDPSNSNLAAKSLNGADQASTLAGQAPLSDQNNNSNCSKMQKTSPDDSTNQVKLENKPNSNGSNSNNAQPASTNGNNNKRPSKSRSDGHNNQQASIKQQAVSGGRVKISSHSAGDYKEPKATPHRSDNRPADLQSVEQHHHHQQHQAQQENANYESNSSLAQQQTYTSTPASHVDILAPPLVQHNHHQELYNPQHQNYHHQQAHQPLVHQHQPLMATPYHHHHHQPVYQGQQHSSQHAPAYNSPAAHHQKPEQQIRQQVESQQQQFYYQHEPTMQNVVVVNNHQTDSPTTQTQVHIQEHEHQQQQSQVLNSLENGHHDQQYATTGNNQADESFNHHLQQTQHYYGHPSNANSSPQQQQQQQQQQQHAHVDDIARQQLRTGRNYSKQQQQQQPKTNSRSASEEAPNYLFDMIPAETRDNENIDGSQQQQAMEGDAMFQLSQPVAIATASTPVTSIENNTKNKSTPESCLREGRDSIREAPSRATTIVYDDLNQQHHRNQSMHLDTMSAPVETTPTLHSSGNTSVYQQELTNIDDETIGSQFHQLTCRPLHQQPSSEKGVALPTSIISSPDVNLWTHNHHHHLHQPHVAYHNQQHHHHQHYQQQQTQHQTLHMLTGHNHHHNMSLTPIHQYHQPNHIHHQHQVEHHHLMASHSHSHPHPHAHPHHVHNAFDVQQHHNHHHLQHHHPYHIHPFHAHSHHHQHQQQVHEHFQLSHPTMDETNSTPGHHEQHHHNHQLQPLLVTTATTVNQKSDYSDHLMQLDQATAGHYHSHHHQQEHDMLTSDLQPHNNQPQLSELLNNGYVNNNHSQVHDQTAVMSTQPDGYMTGQCNDSEPVIKRHHNHHPVDSSKSTSVSLTKINTSALTTTAKPTAATTTTTTTLRTVLNNHHKQVSQKLSVRFHRIKTVYNHYRPSIPRISLKDNTTPDHQTQHQHQHGEVVSQISLQDILDEIDHYTLDWRKHSRDCLKMISESQNCTNIIITRMPLIVALGHLICLGFSEFFDIDQIYSSSKTCKEACIKRIKKRFGAANRCSYIIVGDKEDLEMAKKLDLPSWNTSRSDGHRQLMQLYTALKEGYLM